MIDLGISGWMADFGEYLPADGAFFNNNQSGRVLHNQWPVLWAKLNREAIEERNKTGDVVFWMRAGFTGMHGFTKNCSIGLTLILLNTAKLYCCYSKYTWPKLYPNNGN